MMGVVRGSATSAPGWVRLATAPRLSWPRAILLILAFVALFMLLRRELRQGIMLLVLQVIAGRSCRRSCAAPR